MIFMQLLSYLNDVNANDALFMFSQVLIKNIEDHFTDAGLKCLANGCSTDQLHNNNFQRCYCNYHMNEINAQ